MDKFVSIFNDFQKALSQISDPKFMRVFFLGIGLTLAIFLAFSFSVMSLISYLGIAAMDVEIDSGLAWLTGGFVGIGGFLLFGLMSVFLMVPVASAITSLFLDQVATAVEDKHYPHLPDAQNVPLYEGLKDTVNFLGVLIAANAAAVILYLLLPFFSPLIFWALNGFLLGREYFQIVAMRRLGRQRAIEFRKQHSREVWFAGCLMAVPLSIPLINLAIPVLGAATFTHVYHRLSAAPSD